MTPLRCLVGCEKSGVIRRAFRAIGCEAWSCDLQPADDGSPFHLQCDVLTILDRDWHLALFHPDCDYLTVSGNRWFSDNAKAGPGILTGESRRKAREEALAFVLKLWQCQIPRVAIENPIGRLSTLWRKPSQTVQPWHFGDPFFKATCLWLRGLPLLEPTKRLIPPAKGTSEHKQWSMVHRATPGKGRKAKRAQSFPGFAAAIAAQWSNPQPEFCNL